MNHAKVEASELPETVLLQLRNLSVAFPAPDGSLKTAVSDVSLTIHDGSVLGLVGESGSGKTVLGRAMFGLPPEPGIITGGQMLFNGQDLYQLSDRELQKIRGKEISIIVSDPKRELNPMITIGEQIGTLARLHLGDSRRESQERALEMLNKVQIPDPKRRMTAYVHELSGGMAQRVVIALALVCSPKLVVSDDATSGLDVTVQRQILDLMKSLIDENNMSMLFITRDLGVAAHFCDEIAVMYRGEIFEIGPSSQIFSRPRNPYTAMLLAAFSHNKKLHDEWQSTGTMKRGPVEGGCLFHDRCPFAQDICRSDHPLLRDVANGQRVRCHFPLNS